MSESPSNDETPAAVFDALLAGARERYDASQDQTMGIEEEFALCDPHTLDLMPRYEDVRLAAIGAGLEQELAGELLASEVEFRTGANATWSDAVSELISIRRRVNEVMGELGLRIASSATHPWADYREQETVDLPYYHELVERLQYVAHRNNTFGLHVHVGVQGADRAIRVHDALRSIQPLLLALSASSPFLDGRDSGLASARSLTFSRTFPRGNVAPAFRSIDGYVEHLRWLRDAGSIDTVGQVWWGTRPHLAHGTVELRMFDGQPDVRDTAALAALAAGTIAHLCDLDDAGDLPEPVEAHLIDENCWRAARYGTDAVFVDVPSTRRVCAAEAIGVLISHARTASVKHNLGLDAGLERAAALLDAGSSAAWQRSLFRESGSLEVTYRAVADATMSSSLEATGSLQL